jgi:hypothetical protein
MPMVFAAVLALEQLWKLPLDRVSSPFTGQNVVFYRVYEDVAITAPGKPRFTMFPLPWFGRRVSFSTWGDKRRFGLRHPRICPGETSLYPGKTSFFALENPALCGRNLVFGRKNEVFPNHRRAARLKDTHECKLLDWRAFRTDERCG